MFRIVINKLSRELFARVFACVARGRGFKRRPGHEVFMRLFTKFLKFLKVKVFA